MQRTIEVSMDHTDPRVPPGYLANLVKECADLREDGTICNICDERVVELAIRKEYRVLGDLLEWLDYNKENPR